MPKKLHVKKKTGVTSQTQEEILKIATSFLLAMTAVFVLAPFVCALAVRIVVIARNEAIFLCFLSRQSCRKLRSTGYTQIISLDRLATSQYTNALLMTKSA